MLKLTLLIALPFMINAELYAQSEQLLTDDSDGGHHRYVSVENGKVYDIEIIVFAYKNALPNADTYQDKSIINDENALWLQPKTVDLSETLANESPIHRSQNVSSSTLSSEKDNKEYTVNLGKTAEQKKILAWFKHEPQQLKLTAIWQRLLNSNNIMPLIHTSWRQQQTPFDDPVYINIGDQNTNTKPLNVNSDNGEQLDSLLPDNENDQFSQSMIQQVLPDFHLTGMVALSKGRFIHFDNQLKLYRQYYDDEGFMKNITFSLQQRRQIKPNELHYFDSPWLGSIVKVTEFTGKTDHE